MPAEWHPHARCWMLWPHRHATWRDEARPARRAFAAVVTAISRFEPVIVGALPHLAEEARAQIEAADTYHPVSVLEMESDDAWMRDCGPTFLTRPTQHGATEVAGERTAPDETFTILCKACMQG